MTSKKRNANKSKPKQNNKPRRVKAAADARIVLDRSAMQYARLLRDPCNGPLVPSLWPGSEGSLVTRFETDFICFNGATETGGIIVYNPGLALCYSNATPVTSDTTATQLTSALLPVPGATFLANTAGSYRCVSACAQVMFAGTELNRAGFLGAGVTTFGSYARNLLVVAGGAGIVTNPSDVRQSCQKVVRMPDDMLEVKWFPGGGDSLFMEGGNTAMTAADVVDAGAAKNCIQISVSGLPVSTGVRVRFVTVMEWTPRMGQGFVSSMSMPRSRFGVNDILSYLGQIGGETWFLSAVKAGARIASSMMRRNDMIAY